MAKGKRRITIEDIYQMKWASDPQISPDGQRIAYVVKETDPNDKTKYISRIWMVETAGGKPLQLTNGPRQDSNPRWSPDGSQLAFNSNRGDGNQIWLLSMRGGEALQLTKGKNSAGTPLWSPDGSQIAFVSRIAPEAAEEGEEKSDVRVITRLHYKQNGAGFLDDKVAQICVVDVASGEQRQVTSGEHNCSSPTWSPCGQYLAFASNRTEDADYNSQSDIWVVPVSGGELRRLTPGAGPCHSPSWSPDGKLIAYVGHNNEYKGATLGRIFVIPAEGGEPRMLTGDFDQTPGAGVGGDMVSSPAPGLIWTADCSQLVFLSSWHGQTHIYQVSVAGDPLVQQISPTEKRVVYGMSYAPQCGRFAVTITQPDNIGDVYTLLAGEEPQRLTELNKKLLDEVELTMPEGFTHEVEGMTTEGWVMKPVGFKPGVKYPLILEVHGGPHAAYGYAFMHEFHVLCAAGFVVLFTNPPGSSGYGQEFLIQTHHDWGGRDYRAIMACVDLVSQYDYVDTERLGVTGGSYGGYMTNWIIGHDNRFKAAVTQRSTCNRYSMFGTSDVGFRNGDFELNGNPWDNPEHYLEHSPITYVKNIETPLLLIHSEQDLRCPIEQAEQFYTALKWLRKEAVFVRFPNENHELSRSGQPRHRVERLQWIVNWMKKYIPVRAEEYAN